MILSRTLALATPLMGSDPKSSLRLPIMNVQKVLKVPVDGVYGEITAGAVQKWKYRAGFADDQVNMRLNPSEALYLFPAQRKPGPLMRIRMALRGRKATAVSIGAAAAANRMLRWAHDGLKEVPPGSNRVPVLVDLAHTQSYIPTWMAAMGYPWCAFAANLAGGLVNIPASIKGFKGEYNVLYVPAIEAAAASDKSLLHKVDLADARYGDLVLFTWNGREAQHIGRFVERIDTQHIRTVEGNTSYDDAGSQANGGAVAERIRNVGLVRAVVRELA